MSAELKDRSDAAIATGATGVSVLRTVLVFENVTHGFFVQRLEVEPIRGIEVGGDGLRVAVRHHCAPAIRAERLGGLDRGVIELDPLTDPDRAGTDHEGSIARLRFGLVLVFVG